MAGKTTLPAGLEFRRNRTVGRENNSVTDRLHDIRIRSTASWSCSRRTATVSSESPDEMNRADILKFVGFEKEEL